MRAWWFVLILGGCAAAQHAEADGGDVDAAAPDAPAVAADGGVDARPDGRLPDAALPDAATPDAATPDAAPDAAPPDAALPDAAAPDGRPRDLRLDSISPPEGLASATLSGAVLRGSGFDASTTVRVGSVDATNCTVIGDNELHCEVPAGTAGRVDVTVQRSDGSSATLTGGFTWTAESADVNWCDVQWPPTATASANAASPYIYGQIYQPGLTDTHSQAAPGITAELGYGPQGSDPRTSNAWRWVAAVPNPGFDFSGNNDEYDAQLTLAAGSYAYVYRFSLDGGIHFTFCDLDTANGGFDPAQEGALTVSP